MKKKLLLLISLLLGVTTTYGADYTATCTYTGTPRVGSINEVVCNFISPGGIDNDLVNPCSGIWDNTVLGGMLVPKYKTLIEGEAGKCYDVKAGGENDLYYTYTAFGVDLGPIPNPTPDRGIINYKYENGDTLELTINIDALNPSDGSNIVNNVLDAGTTKGVDGATAVSTSSYGDATFFIVGIAIFVSIVALILLIPKMMPKRNK